MVGPLVSRDDLDELSDRANDAADPPAVAAQLVEAASGTLADPADAAYAYLLAAEIQEQVDDLPQALALVERALAAAGAAAHDLRRARSYRARLLLQLGREDEAAPEEYEQGEEFDDDLADPDAFVAEPDPRPRGGVDLADLDQERYAPYLDPDGSPEAR